MIPIQGETLIPLREVPKHLPARPSAKRVHISACYRWVSTGVRGVVLESLKIGGTTYTSLEAIERFARQLSRHPSDSTNEHRDTPARTRSLNGTAARLEWELGLPSGRLNRRTSAKKDAHPEHPKGHS